MTKNKVCFECYKRATIYQAPEIGLKPLCIFPEQLTTESVECEVHDLSDSVIWHELLSWVDNLTPQ